MPTQQLSLLKIHAYEVVPQRLQEKISDPKGGAFEAEESFKLELEDYLKKSKLPTRSEIAFRFNDKANEAVESHAVRSSILDFLFGASATSKKASLDLARRLSRSMDDRSPYTLLMLVAYKGETDDTFRRIVMWAFPKDEPFEFTASSGTAKIKIPENIFSRSSTFKKGSLYEGFQSDDAFLQGFVIDRQAESSWGTAADYWVSSFLDSQFTLTGLAGTRLLARTLKLTYDNLENQKDKNQITDSIRAAFTSTKKRLSIQQYANNYLTDSAKTLFLEMAPSETVKTVFSFDKKEFEEKVQLRVFRLDDDVVISAPFSTIDKSVTITGKDRKKIRVVGNIVEETVKPGKRKRKPTQKQTGVQKLNKKSSA